MNDRYLFKAKTCNGEWVTGLLSHKDKKYYISNKAGMPFAFEVRPDTICQCTGLKDKKGNLIWENDIVEYDGETGIVKFGYYDWNWCSENIGFHIGWKKIGYRKDLGYWLNKISVIGSSIDNPELLEVER